MWALGNICTKEIWAERVKKDTVVLILKHICGYSKVAVAVEWKLAQVFELLNVATVVAIIAVGVQCGLLDSTCLQFWHFPIVSEYYDSCSYLHVTPLRDRLAYVVLLKLIISILLNRVPTFIFRLFDSTDHVLRLGSRGVKLFFMILIMRNGEQ
jgi:hypothetical protein